MTLKFSLLGLSLVLGACMPPPEPVGQAPVQALNPMMDMPQIEAWVDDKAIALAVDTGATQPVILFSDAVRRLGGRLTGKGLMQTTRVQVALKKDGLPLSNRTDVVIVESSPYEGLLGWATVRQYAWHLNMSKDEHHFASAVPTKVKKSWSRTKLIPNEVYPQLLDPRGRQIILDTGAPFDVYLSKSCWRAFKAQYPNATPMLYSGYSPAAGGDYVLECLYVEEFTLGPIHLHNAVICESFADKKILGLKKDIDVILGRGAFNQSEAWLDGVNHYLYQKSVPYYGGTRHALNLVGISFLLKDSKGYQYVAKVMPGSLAWKSGLRNGDLIQSINGIKYLNRDHLSYVTTQTGAKVKLIAKRGSKYLTCNWTVPQRPLPSKLVKAEPPPSPFSLLLPVPILVPNMLVPTELEGAGSLKLINPATTEVAPSLEPTKKPDGSELSPAGVVF